MFKVFSLLHRQQTYVVDVGVAKKQLEWLNKIHGLIRRVIEQAKKGRILSTKVSSDQQKVSFCPCVG